MSTRSSGYNNFEDILLCQVYVEVSQDPITGRYQSLDRFWSRIEEKYNAEKKDNWECRSKRSLQSRFTVIEKAIRKLNSCIRQVENMHPSGANNQDILDKAKQMLMQDGNYIKGFRFDHVWNILKNFEKFKDDVNPSRQFSRKQTLYNISSESDNPTPESPNPNSPGLSSFDLNLSDDTFDGSSMNRPIGVKKAKGKRKIEEDNSKKFSIISKQNERILKILEDNTEDRKKLMGLQAQNVELKRQNTELKIMAIDPDTCHPRYRAFVEAQQNAIQARLYQQQPPPPPPSPPQQNAPLNNFYDYLNNIGGDNINLPDF